MGMENAYGINDIYRIKWMNLVNALEIRTMP